MLRFRGSADEGANNMLTQKLPLDNVGESAIATIYLDKHEFALLNIFDAVTDLLVNIPTSLMARA